jgi:hypothetical protein
MVVSLDIGGASILIWSHGANGIVFHRIREHRTAPGQPPQALGVASGQLAGYPGRSNCPDETSRWGASVTGE